MLIILFYSNNRYKAKSPYKFPFSTQFSFHRTPWPSETAQAHTKAQNSTCLYKDISQSVLTSILSLDPPYHTIRGTYRKLYYPPGAELRKIKVKGIKIFAACYRKPANGKGERGTQMSASQHPLCFLPSQQFASWCRFLQNQRSWVGKYVFTENGIFIDQGRLSLPGC